MQLGRGPGVLPRLPAGWGAEHDHNGTAVEGQYHRAAITLARILCETALGSDRPPISKAER